MKCPGLFFVSLVILTSFICGCEKEDILSSNLPVNYSDSIYNINNREAAARVLTIKMGNLGGREAEWYNRFLITHISDSHVSYMSPDNCVSIDKTISCKNLKESIRFSNQLKPGSKKSLLDINCIVSTGDMINNWKNDSKRAALNRLDYFMTFFNENNKISSILCTGNHDSGFMASDTSAYLNKEDIYNAVTKRINTPVNGLQDENYF